MIILLGKNGRRGFRSLLHLLSNDVEVVVKKTSRRTGKPFYRRLKDNSKVFLSQDTMMRWGCSVPLKRNGLVTYNEARSIDLASNKADTRISLNVAGIPVPRIVHPQQADVNWPVIVRPHYHRAGQNFQVINSWEGFSYDDLYWYYFSEAFPKTKEFRVHVAFGKALAVQEKPKPNDNNIAWNRAANAGNQDSWELQKWSEVSDNVVRTSIQAVQAIGLDTGGVDIMQAEDGTVAVLEINTAPSISTPYMRDRYARLFNQIAKHRRFPWFNYQEIKITKNLFWKNFQLDG